MLCQIYDISELMEFRGVWVFRRVHEMSYLVCELSRRVHEMSF